MARVISMTLISTMMPLSSTLILAQQRRRTVDLGSVDGGAVVAVTVIGGLVIPGALETKQRRRTSQTRLVRPQPLIQEILAHRGHLGATKKTRKRLPPPPASTLETLVVLRRRKNPRLRLRLQME